MEAEKTFNSGSSENSRGHKGNDCARTWGTADEIDFLHSCLLGTVRITVPPVTWIKRYLLSMDKRRWPKNMNRDTIEQEGLWLLEQLKMNMLNSTTSRFSPYYSRSESRKTGRKGWSLEDLR